MRFPFGPICAFSLVLIVLSPPLLAKKKQEPLATLNFVVLRDENGKPIRNAAVVMHPVGENGKQGRGGLELKTDPEGKASYEGVPYGKLRVQVLAPGFQTYGEDYEIVQPTMDITIKLKRPAAQYSIYGQQPAANEGKPPQEPKDKPQN
jgi:Carboxypeptidase regulatory-like domain